MPPRQLRYRHPMLLKHRLWLTTITLLMLSACQPGTGTIPVTKPIQVETLSSELSGDYQLAGEQYLQLATEHEGAEQAAYYLKAASMFWREGAAKDSQAALDKINKTLLASSQRNQAALIAANIALFNADGQSALDALAITNEKNLSATDNKNYLQLKADAYALTGNWLEAANTHLALEKILTDETALANNREALWQSLLQMTPQALDLFNPGYPPSEDSGWFALAYNIKAYQSNPEVLQVALEDWARTYPNHPADPAIYKQTLEAGTFIPKDVDDIAVLLPTTGPFVEAAAAVKEAIIAAHFASNSTAQLEFYAIETDPLTGQSNVISQYDKAVASGAKVVIGPLQKSSVEQLAKYPDLPVPVIALNRVDSDSQTYSNLYQFGLAPEDDAESVAELAKLKGYKRTVILAPTGDWGQRIAKSFTKKWQSLGGSIIYSTSYDENDNDFRETLIPLMGLDQSQQRYQSLKSSLGRSMEFEPRRRQDIDFLFLVAKPLKARQLVPQLKFHRSGDLPILATSHAYSGFVDPQQNIDLNNLVITELPWVYSTIAEQDPVYIALQDQSPQNYMNNIKLYALGVDAYRLVSELNTLSRDTQAQMNGASGILSVSEQGHVVRHLLTGKFEEGELKLTQ